MFAKYEVAAITNQGKQCETVELLEPDIDAATTVAEQNLIAKGFTCVVPVSTARIN